MPGAKPPSYSDEPGCSRLTVAYPAHSLETGSWTGPEGSLFSSRDGAPGIRALPVRHVGLECVVWRNGTNRATAVVTESNWVDERHPLPAADGFRSRAVDERQRR